MLGDKARVVAMPTLEITADNVECSHGASVADLDENSMFYLASRGVNRLVSSSSTRRLFVTLLLRRRRVSCCCEASPWKCSRTPCSFVS